MHAFANITYTGIRYFNQKRPGDWSTLPQS